MLYTYSIPLCSAFHDPLQMFYIHIHICRCTHVAHSMTPFNCATSHYQHALNTTILPQHPSIFILTSPIHILYINYGQYNKLNICSTYVSSHPSIQYVSLGLGGGADNEPKASWRRRICRVNGGGANRLAGNGTFTHRHLLSTRVSSDLSLACQDQELRTSLLFCGMARTEQGRMRLV